jgi:hypothetical protein
MAPGGSVNSAKAEPKEPLAELGVAPGNDDSTPKLPPPRLPLSAVRLPLATLAAAAAAYAAAEILATIFVGRFFSWGRAEALLSSPFVPGSC